MKLVRAFLAAAALAAAPTAAYAQTQNADCPNGGTVRFGVEPVRSGCAADADLRPYR